MDLSKGFTLLELMIVVAIVAVLSTLAVASYRHYVFRARRADARQMLMSIAHGEERWYATYNRYTDDLAKFGYDAATLPGATYQPLLTIDDGAQRYEAAALPINNQATDACGTMALDSTGKKTPDRMDTVANANGRCW